MLLLHLLHCSQPCRSAAACRCTSSLLLLLLPGWRRHLASYSLCSCVQLLRCSLQQLLVLLSKRQLAQCTHALPVAGQLQQSCNIIVTQHILTSLHPLLSVLIYYNAASLFLLLLMSSAWLCFLLGRHTIAQHLLLLLLLLLPAHLPQRSHHPFSRSIRS
jgi:hypothetical protein